MSNTNKFDFSDLELDHELPDFKLQDYILQPALSNAVKVAMYLQQPLLITGKPGTGKTRLAEKLAGDLAQEFGTFLPFPLVFNTKTISAYTDLLYQYDALGHFHRANITDPEQAKKMGSADVYRFIQLNAMGQAIMLSTGAFRGAYKNMRLLDDFLKKNPEVEKNKQPLGTVVLIDEVDKAPRDFTNDLLNELDRFEFTVREDENTTYEKGKGNIFVIITSNSEKGLPDAFLRRCVFYHIDPPGDEFFREIIVQKLTPAMGTENSLVTNALIDDYLEVFKQIRECTSKKEPSTAELINWLFYLRPHILLGRKFSDIDLSAQRASYGILAKTSEDLKNLTNLFKTE